MFRPRGFSANATLPILEVRQWDARNSTLVLGRVGEEGARHLIA